MVPPCSVLHFFPSLTASISARLQTGSNVPHKIGSTKHSHDNGPSVSVAHRLIGSYFHAARQGGGDLVPEPSPIHRGKEATGAQGKQ